MAIRPSWIENKKERFNDVPWMVIDQGWRKVEVIKVWHNDPCKDSYTRWMVKAWMPGNEEWADYGDEYCHGILASGRLVEVLGEVPTSEQLVEWRELQLRSVKLADPFAAMGLG